MTYSSTLTTKNQTTIPKAVVAALGASPSDTLSYELMPDNSVRLSAKSATFAGLKNAFPKKKPAKPVTVEAMKATVAAGVARRFKKSAG